MSIKTSCPNCEAPYTLADTQRGKKVRCRKCTNTFVVGGASDDDAPAPAAARSGKIRKDGVSTSPRPASKTPPPKSKPAAISRDRDRDREDDDEDDGPPRKPDLKKKGSSTPMILMIVGGILLLFLMCGGVATFAAYWYTRNTVTDIGNNIVDNINNIPNDPNNPPQIIVPPGFPQPPVIPPNGFPFGVDPKDVGEALAWVNGGETVDKRNRGADWLARATVDEARQKEVAKALEGLAKNPNSHDAAIRGLATWATLDDCPTLMKEASDLNSPAADALVRLQYAPAAAVFARHLGDFGGGHVDASRRLAQMGKMAESEVLKYMNAPGDAHTEALALLAGYGTTDDVKFGQCLKDLKSPVTDYVRNACDSIAKTPVDEARRAEVSKALEAALSDSNHDTRKAAVVALKTWGTKDNVPALIAEMDRKDDFFGGTFEECVNALVKLKDEKGAQAIAAHLPDFGGNRDVVVKGLRDIGPIAEKYVVAYVNNRDEGVRNEADKLLKGYGTKGDVVFDAMVADLDAKDMQQRKAACEYFGSQPLDAAKQKTVARALEKLLDDRDIFSGIPDLAAKALGVWGDKDSGTALVIAMQKKDSKCWQTAVDALVKLKDERAVVPLILATQDFFHKDAAKKALTELGPIVETALDNIVADPAGDPTGRIAACKLLADPGIGTSKSVPVLQAATMDTNAGLKTMAVSVLKLVKARP